MSIAHPSSDLQDDAWFDDLYIPSNYLYPYEYIPPRYSYRSDWEPRPDGSPGAGLGAEANEWTFAKRQAGQQLHHSRPV